MDYAKLSEIVLTVLVSSVIGALFVTSIALNAIEKRRKEYERRMDELKKINEFYKHN